MSKHQTTDSACDRASLLADIEYLVARIEALQDHASTHPSLKDAQLELIEKRELLASS